MPEDSLESLHFVLEPIKKGLQMAMKEQARTICFFQQKQATGGMPRTPGLDGRPSRAFARQGDEASTDGAEESNERRVRKGGLLCGSNPRVFSFFLVIFNNF